MRGKGFAHSVISSDFGITPAHAGKREEDTDEKKQQKDHPRACGEK